MGSWLKRIFSASKKESSGVLGINLSPWHVAWCLLDSASANPRVKRFHCLEQEFSNPVQALSALLESAPLPKVSCEICLDHSYYNMLLVDAPDVPDEEIRDAIKWKVKDLIPQDLASMVVDGFRLPADAYRGRMNMLYVAATESKIIQDLVDVCERNGICLDGIGVNELSMSALAKLNQAGEDVGSAVLYLNGSSGTINLIENGHLYLTRTIELANGAATYSGSLDFQADPVDNLALDVQRSLDYYESQLGKSGVTRLYLVAANPEHRNWCEGLAERLPIQASLFQLDDMPGADEIGEQMGQLAPAIGIALGRLDGHP